MPSYRVEGIEQAVIKDQRFLPDFSWNCKLVHYDIYYTIISCSNYSEDIS